MRFPRERFDRLIAALPTKKLSRPQSFAFCLAAFWIFLTVAVLPFNLGDYGSEIKAACLVGAFALIVWFAKKFS